MNINRRTSASGDRIAPGVRLSRPNPTPTPANAGPGSAPALGERGRGIRGRGIRGRGGRGPGFFEPRVAPQDERVEPTLLVSAPVLPSRNNSIQPIVPTTVEVGSVIPLGAVSSVEDQPQPLPESTSDVEYELTFDDVAFLLSLIRDDDPQRYRNLLDALDKIGDMLDNGTITEADLEGPNVQEFLRLVSEQLAPRAHSRHPPWMNLAVRILCFLYVTVLLIPFCWWIQTFRDDGSDNPDGGSQWKNFSSSN